MSLLKPFVAFYRVEGPFKSWHDIISDEEKFPVWFILVLICPNEYNLDLV